MSSPYDQREWARLERSLSKSFVSVTASMSVRKSSHGTIFLIVSSGSPRALIASSLRSTSKKHFCPITRPLHPPMTAHGHRVRFAATWREEFFEVPIIAKQVQDVEVSFFGQLQKDDVLFIDSSHVLKIDGDVPFLYLEVLPTLNVGVVVYSRVGFIVRNMSCPAERVLAFGNKRGTGEQWLQEGKGAIKWMRLCAERSPPTRCGSSFMGSPTRTGGNVGSHPPLACGLPASSENSYHPRQFRVHLGNPG